MMKVYTMDDRITIRCERYLLSSSPFSAWEYTQMIIRLQRLMDVYNRVELELIGDRTMSQYSKQYHSIFAPTNILSFESSIDIPAILILSLETAKRESILYNQDYDKYILHLLTHGFVHSVGFEHGIEMEKHCARCYYTLVSFL